VQIAYKKVGNQGKALLTATLPDRTAFTDKIDITDARGRKRFLDGLCRGRKGIDKSLVARELERIAAEIGQEVEAQRRSQADMMVDLVLGTGIELFHTPGGHDSEAYATFETGGRRETWPVASRGFERYLTRLYHERFDKVPGSQAVQDAKNLLAGKALFEGSEHPVSVRLAMQDGVIWLDLGDPQWQAVRITRDGWEVTADVSVKFRRRRGMLALPEPVRGGNLDEFFVLVNLPTEEQRVLFIGWLLKAYRPGTPFPVLNVNGEQGSAKTTLCRMARELVDPNEAPLRRPPRTEHDLVIAAANSWVVGFDNLSGISAELSDALCCLSTGGGFGTRELFTDDEEKLFRAMRPVIINGIEDVVWRPDLLDRSVNLLLPEIDPAKRRDELQLWAAFYAARPRVLGKILDLVVTALANEASVVLDRSPRMVDFARWVTAAEPALGWRPGRFLEVYTQNRGEAESQILENSLVAQAVIRLVAAQGAWQGTATALLSDLAKYGPDEPARKDRKWPKTPGALSGMLRRLAPTLRKGARINPVLDFRDGTKARNKLIRLERLCEPPSESVRQAETSAVAGASDAADADLHACSNVVTPMGEEDSVWTC
jgi:hypothetical protein